MSGKKIQLTCFVVIHFTLVYFFATTLSDRVSLQKYQVAQLLKPSSLEELQKIILSAEQPLSIMGGNYSQGGQTIIEGGTVIDMTDYDKIINLDPINKTITVQTGITWRKIQEIIDPYDLSIRVMQSYNDFTVGGSLGVNVHARDLRFGNLINSIKSFKILVADGSIITASNTENNDLFTAAIGGYGLLGIIVEATLLLTDNVLMERTLNIMSIKRYTDFFKNCIINDKSIIFHSAILWPNDFETVMCNNLHITEQESSANRLQSLKPTYPKKALTEFFIRRISPLKTARPYIEALFHLGKNKVWRNYEMGYSVNELGSWSNFFSTSILQEYFIPINSLDVFVGNLRTLIKEHDINVLNIAIRHVPADKKTILSYAPEESFSLVIYINIWNTTHSKTHAEIWTQKIINAALAVDGSYYLPYQLFATKSQFNQAYPSLEKFLSIKKQYDPTNRFRNALFEKYMSNKKI